MNELWAAMFAHLWQSTIVIVAIAVVVRLLRRAPSRVTAALWSLALVKLFLPVQIFGRFAHSLLDGLAAASTSGRETAGTVWVVDPVYVYLGVMPTANEHLPGWIFGALTALWIGGAIGVGTLAVRRYRRRGAMLRLDEGSASRKLAAVARGIGLSTEHLAITESAVLPEVRGIWRPRIILPVRLIERLDRTELAAVLLHEESHRRRRDPLRSMLFLVATALFFFYLPVWWIVRRIHQATESACDEAVLAAGIAPDLYRRALARSVFMGLEPAASSVSIGGRESSKLGRRLGRLGLHGSIVMTPRHRFSFGSAVLIVALSTFLPSSTSTSPWAVAGEPDAAVGEDVYSDLEQLADAELPITLSFDRVPLDRILDAIEKTSSVEFRRGELFRAGRPISIQGRESPLAEALIQLGIVAGLRYDVVDPYTVIVRSLPLVAGADGVGNPVLIPESKVQPVYPEEMRRQGLTANVILQAVIDELGSVHDIEVLRSSEPNHPEFAESAIAALQQWRYEPATLRGEPVEVYFTVFIQFALSDKDDPK